LKHLVAKFYKKSNMRGSIGRPGLSGTSSNLFAMLDDESLDDADATPLSPEDQADDVEDTGEAPDFTPTATPAASQNAAGTPAVMQPNRNPFRRPGEVAD
jgi:hypothetical protein